MSKDHALTFENWDGKKLFVDAPVKFKDVLHFSIRGFFVRVCSVPLLPKELSGPDERRWVLELPPDDIVPLI